MNSGPLLEVEDLRVTYRGRRGLKLRRTPIDAVRGVSFSIHPGRTLGLVGESGSGKTSIANAILGLVKSTVGSMRFSGTELTQYKNQYPAAVRKQMQTVFQDPYSSLNPSMSVEDIVGEPFRVHSSLNRAERRDQVIELLNLVSLPEEHLGRHPYEFSGGQRQRISIARALALKPKLLVLDEPVSALDVSTQNQVINLLYALRDELGLAYLLIAHDLALVHHISDRIAVMYRGHIVEEGPAERVYSAPAHPYTLALIEAVPVPDPREQRSRRAKRRAALPPTNGVSDLIGCSYQGRCPRVMPICRQEAPPAFPVREGGVARCFLYSDVGSNGPSSHLHPNGSEA